MRERFIEVTEQLLKEEPRTALVLADISAALFADAAARHPDRVINVGIREQLMLGVAGGLALTGLRPIAHTYAPFMVERGYHRVRPVAPVKIAVSGPEVISGIDIRTQNGDLAPGPGRARTGHRGWRMPISSTRASRSAGSA